MKKSLTFALSATCGLAVANIYYNQPLLVLFAQTFHMNPADTSLLSTLVQFSYAIGLILLAPLGDKVCRRKLILFILIFNAISQAIAAYSPNYHILVFASILIGITSITAQIIIPAVSLLSPDKTKGRDVGIIMTGLFAGILFARVLSGFIGHYAGWRSMYWLSSGIDIFLIILIFYIFPKIKPVVTISYFQLITSLYQIFMKEKILRNSCLCGALMFSTFSALWGSLAYLLSLQPYLYSSNIVGMFGLAGIAGMFGSAYIGSLSDRIGAKKVVTLSAIIVCISFALIINTKFSLIFLILGILVLDFGGRAGLISNQLRLFSLPQALRSRLNTVFMSIYFIGGAVGTKIGAEISYKYGWHGLAILGMAIASFVVVFNVSTSK